MSYSSPDVQVIVQGHRDAILTATEDFDIVAELKDLYRRAIASGALAVANNSLATLGRLENLEPVRRFEVRNLDPGEMDRQIDFYSSVIDQARSRLHS